MSDELKSHGLRTDIYPAEDAFFMRPLISAMAVALGKIRRARLRNCDCSAITRIACGAGQTPALPLKAASSADLG